MHFLDKLFDSNTRAIKKLRPIVDRINALEENYKTLSNEKLQKTTETFKKRLKESETLDDILPEAFAVVREAARRIIGQRHFDVQLMGGIVLHQGKIAEMKTGEGKTLTSTLPTYLNALTGNGVHVVTVNDYLARRDCNWMGSVYHFLGLSTACITNNGSYRYEPKKVDDNEVTIEHENLVPTERKDAYAADITYGTNNEFGFDYLRDNMVRNSNQIVQRAFHYAIVDEVDSILIDEARTPLIISAPDKESGKLYQQFASIVTQLKETDDYIKDEKLRAVSLTDAGISKVEQLLGISDLYAPGKIAYVHALEQSLRANILYTRDRDYVVRDGQVLIVDDFTGRIMEGRRYGEGLHQALEAKEGVTIQKESRTLATITFQNYFRMYTKLAGMTGTAATSKEEFQKVYNLDVVSIPTNQPIKRKDLPDVLYKNERGKLRAITEKVAELHAKGQPVLVGTIAIEKSEILSDLFTKKGIPHTVLNAKHHEKEAAIIASAGKTGAVTIATNMAGRGTDIKLDNEAKASGGLYIIGTERHEARRIDDQLRGRSGRQGDPGTTQFYISLEDELIRRFGGDRLKTMMDSLNMPEDEPITSRIFSRAVESAQSRIEGFNFDIRKHVLDYDDVMDKQRDRIYERRRQLLDADSNALEETFRRFAEDELRNLSTTILTNETGEPIDEAAAVESVTALVPLTDEEKITVKKALEMEENKEKQIAILSRAATDAALRNYRAKREATKPEVFDIMVKNIILETIDNMWMNHLDEMDYLRQGIGLRGYGQRDPLIEYKKESFVLFSNLLSAIRTGVIKAILTAHVPSPKSTEAANNNETDPLVELGMEILKDIHYSGASEADIGKTLRQEAVIPIKDILQGVIAQSSTGLPNTNGRLNIHQKPTINLPKKPNRNDPCTCGSGKKYKKCCGR